uniref:Uncharacterized protein n=1 Tax=Solanum tuberosum TaxID=4113 RepID=M1DG51_SOLTU
MKILEFHVFGVRDKAWTLLSRKEQGNYWRVADLVRDLDIVRHLDIQINWKSYKIQRGLRGSIREVGLKIDSVTFGEKHEVAESLLDRPLSAPLNSFCTITLGELILARQKLLAIRRKTLCIVK